jgi:hypothetical protein
MLVRHGERHVRTANSTRHGFEHEVVDRTPILLRVAVMTADTGNLRGGIRCAARQTDGEQRARSFGKDSPSIVPGCAHICHAPNPSMIDDRRSQTVRLLLDRVQSEAEVTRAHRNPVAPAP